MSPRHLCRKSSNVFNLASMTEEYPRAASPVSSLRGYRTLPDEAFIKNNISQRGDFDKSQSNGTKAVDLPSNGTAGMSDDNKEEKAEDKEKNEYPPVGFFTLFRYSSGFDKFLIFIGCIIALIAGAAMPTIIVLFGKIVNSFVDHQKGPVSTNTDNENITTYMPVNSTNSTGNRTDNSLDHISDLCIYLCSVGSTVFVLNYIMVSCFSLAAANQAFRIRCLFMQSILKQDIGWFDTNETGDFASRITADLVRIQDGIGEKVGMCIAFTSTCILSIICALYYGWKLTLVMLSVMPIMTVAMAVITKIQSSVSGDELSSYGAAGSVAEEVLSSIKTVVAFGGEAKEIERYDKNLVFARKKGIRRGLLTSIGSGLFWLIIYSSYALAFWYGVKLIVESRNQKKTEYDPSVLIIVFFNVMMGAMGIGQTAPYFEAFAIARGAAGKIFMIIARTPPIDSSSPAGMILPSLEGDIKFEDVHFSYPSRPDVPILQGLTLSADPGETVALVGPSGCGKSTVIQLIQRFYDPLSGSVFVDQNSVKDINLGWLRDNIGVVGQEPVLFSTTIAENISYGKKGATQEEIEKAARSANAHDFIVGLPKKYNTLVGERGTQLSGGQKQRIAIARALVRNPKILLLDEATSALDTESESIVQAALDKARLGRTTLIVAHRLSTIRTADKIIVISDGIVKETGTHSELMEQNGLYYQLVTAQVGEEENIEISSQTHIHFKPEFERQISIISSGSFTSEDFLPRASRTFSRTFSFSNVKVTTVDEEEEDKNANPSQIRLMQISSPEWPFLVIGCISAFLMGLSIPLYGLLFGDILGVLAEPNDEKIMKDIIYYAILFVAMGVGAGTAVFLQTFMFSIAGERLTSRLRKLAFTAMITQDMSWYDHPKNNTGSLCSRLSSDASSVQGATGSRMGTLFQSLSTLICAIIIGIYICWKLGLVALAFIPVVLMATFFESRIVSGHMLNEKSATELASKIAIEAIENARTVASLHQEETFYIQFKSALIKPYKKFRRNSHVRGLTYGFAQSIPSFAYAASMYYGSILVQKGELKYADLFKVVESVIFGTAMVGQAVAFAPDYQKARVAAVHIFKLLDLRPVIDVFSSEGLCPDETKGNVSFSNIRFNYPSRTEVKVLRSLDLKINTGQTVALVGSSGCGKSTCIQLLERFYDAQHGEVLVDNTDVKELNISWLRSQIGIVSQEPVLFGYSIAENIAYGDNSRSVPMDEIIEAARQANIHTFVSSLPQGYETAVGDRGTQLSGGQKQRIAIARALVRNPKILLLDEATSALDAESEKVVQEALDKASKGRTCIIIAHRLSTIQNADVIVVIRRGKVVEQGKHQELLAKRGYYFKLHNSQGTTKE